jgi:hypothetical protein
MHVLHNAWQRQIEQSNDQDSHQQRTESWYALRAKTLGGSEIATVLEECRYKTVRQLLAEKIGQQRFDGNAATRWGTLFEPVTRRLTAIMLCLPYEIFEANSLPGCFPSQRYSPDGLAVVRLLNNQDVYALYRILFEFKAPHSSLPAQFGRIPDHYAAQVQCGLYSIMSAHAAIFVNNIYRRTSLADLNNGAAYCTTYHKGRVLTDAPIAAGVIRFVRRAVAQHGDEHAAGQSEESNDCTATRIPSIWRQWAARDTAVDLGLEDPAIFDLALQQLADQRDITVDYCEPCVFKSAMKLPIIVAHRLHPTVQENITAENITHLNLRDKKCIAYLPWKLMISDIVIQRRVAGWYEAAAPKVADFIERLMKLHSSPDPAAALQLMYRDEAAAMYEKEAVGGLLEFMNT